MIEPANRDPMEHVVDLIGAYVDDELSGEQRDRVDAHVPRCPACQRELEATVTLDARLRAEFDPEPAGRREWADALGERVSKESMRGVRRPVWPGELRARSGFRPWVLGVGGLAAGLVLAFWIQRSLDPATPTRPVVVSAIGEHSWRHGAKTKWNPTLPSRGALPRSFELRTSDESRVGLEITPGRRIRVNVGSELALAGDQLTLRGGEIWVEQAAFPGRALHGSSPGGTLTCEAAEFSWWVDGTMALLTVYRGHVDYRSTGGDRLRVSSREKVQIIEGRAGATESVFFPEKYLAWTYDLLRLDESAGDEQRTVLHGLLLGLDESEAGLARERILIDTFGALAIEPTVAFLTAGPWHTTPDTRRRAARMLPSLALEPLAAARVEPLFSLLLDDDPAVASSAFVALERATGVRVVDRKTWNSLTKGDERKELIDKWHSAWKLKVAPQ